MSGGGGAAKTKTDWTPQQRDYIESVTGFADDTLLPYLESTFGSAKSYPGAYEGQRVADLTDSEQWATDLLGSNADRTAVGYDELLGGGGFGLDAALANNPELIDKLYNPQAERVIDATLADMAQTHGEQQAALGQQMGNAWGGSRAGVAIGKLAGDYNRAVGTVGAQMRKDAFDTASGLATKDLDRWQTGIGLQNDALKGQAGSNVAAGNALLNAGTLQRGVDQANADVGYQNFLEERDWGWNTLGKANAAIPGNLPGMSQADTSSGAGGPNKMASAATGAVGGAAAGAAMGAAAGGIGAIPGALLGGIAGGAGGYASDERLKTDLEPVGSLPIYNYRFRDEPPGTVHTGPMAQDVAEVMPEAVTQTEDGVLAINPNQMAGGRFAGAPDLQRLAQQLGLLTDERMPNYRPSMPASGGERMPNYPTPSPQGPDGLTGVQMAPMATPQGDMNDMGWDEYQGDPDPRIKAHWMEQEAAMRGLSPRVIQMMKDLGFMPSASDQAVGAYGRDYEMPRNMSGDPTPSSAQRQNPPRPTSKRVLPQFREQAPMPSGMTSEDMRALAEAYGPQAPGAGARPQARPNMQAGMTGSERTQRGAPPRPQARGIAAAAPSGGTGTGWNIYDNPSDTPAYVTSAPARKPSQDRSLEPGLTADQVRAANVKIDANRAANAPMPAMEPAGGGDLWSMLAGMIQRGGQTRAGVTSGRG